MVLFSVAVTGVFKIYFSYVILIPRVLFLIRFSSFVHSRGFPQMSGDLWMSACVQKGDTHLWPLAVCESGGLPAVAPLPRGPTQANPLVRTVGSSSSGSLDSPEQLSASCQETPPHVTRRPRGSCGGRGRRGVRQCHPVSLLSGRRLHPRLCLAPTFPSAREESRFQHSGSRGQEARWGRAGLGAGIGSKEVCRQDSPPRHPRSRRHPASWCRWLSPSPVTACLCVLQKSSPAAVEAGPEGGARQGASGPRSFGETPVRSVSLGLTREPRERPSP